MGTAQEAEDARVRVGVVLSHGPIDPVILSQHILIDVGVHALARASRREGPPTSHVHVEDSISNEVVMQEGTALQCQSHMGQLRVWVGAHHWRTKALDLSNDRKIRERESMGGGGKL